MFGWRGALLAWRGESNGLVSVALVKTTDYRWSFRKQLLHHDLWFAVMSLFAVCLYVVYAGFSYAFADVVA